jgi:hypothetical protein
VGAAIATTQTVAARIAAAKYLIILDSPISDRFSLAPEGAIG